MEFFAMNRIQTWLESAQGFLTVPLISIGKTTVTLGSVLYLVIFVLLLAWISGLMRRLLVRVLNAKSSVEPGHVQAIGTMVRYTVVFIGLVIAIQTAGIDLTTLNVLAGAVGLGVGFGLQGLAANFISGLVLLIGRPIKVGDRIELGTLEGDVVDIGARATTVVTNDNITIIVPNSTLVTEQVVNWSHSDWKVRFKIPVQVAYGTDVRLAEKLLLDVAEADPDILHDPAPSVRFMEFCDSGVKLELRAWSTSLIRKRGLLLSNLNFAIYDKFAEKGVEIPFPQRVVHMRGERG